MYNTARPEGVVSLYIFLIYIDNVPMMLGLGCHIDKVT